MLVHLAPADYVLRVWAEGNTYGDPYAWACSVERIDSHTVELMGALRAPKLSECRAIRDYFRLLDKKVIIRRFKSGVEFTRHKV